MRCAPAVRQLILCPLSLSAVSAPQSLFASRERERRAADGFGVKKRPQKLELIHRELHSKNHGGCIGAAACAQHVAVDGAWGHDADDTREPWWRRGRQHGEDRRRSKRAGVPVPEPLRGAQLLLHLRRPRGLRARTRAVRGGIQLWQPVSHKLMSAHYRRCG